MAISTQPSPAKNSTRLFCRSARGRIARHTTAATVPPTMYGMRRPTRVRVLSLSLPNSGSMNSASTLSSAMTTPMSVSSTAKVSFKISGIRSSYTCQNAQMDRKARPTRVVRL